MFKGKLFFVVVWMLVSLFASAHQSAAQQSCPNVVTFGVQPPSARTAGETRRVRVTGIYFQTNDPGAFIPEAADREHSSSFIRVKTTDFLSRMKQLEQQSAANINSQLVGNLFIGDAAEFNLERNAFNAFREADDLGSTTLDSQRWFNLDRQTTVRLKLKDGETFYRVMLLSSYVEVKPDAAQVTVDLDAGTFLQPGETAVYKLLSDYEVARADGRRSYFALSLSPVAE